MKLFKQIALMCLCALSTSNAMENHPAPAGPSAPASASTPLNIGIVGSISLPTVLGVPSIAYSPDHKTIIMQTQTAVLLRLQSLNRHSRFTNCRLDFSPTGTYVVARDLANNRTIILNAATFVAAQEVMGIAKKAEWNHDDSAIVLEMGAGLVHCTVGVSRTTIVLSSQFAGFSPDGATAYFFTAKQFLALKNGTFKEIFRPADSAQKITMAGMCPDKTKIAITLKKTGSSEPHTILCNTNDGHIVGGPAEGTGICFSKDNARCLLRHSGVAGNSFTLHASDDLRQIGSPTPQTIVYQVGGFFGLDGKILRIGGNNGCNLYETQTGTCIATAVVNVIESKNHAVLAAHQHNGADSTLVVHANGKTLPIQEKTIGLSPDGSIALTSAIKDKQTRISGFDTHTGMRLWCKIFDLPSVQVVMHHTGDFWQLRTGDAQAGVYRLADGQPACLISQGKLTPWGATVKKKDVPGQYIVQSTRHADIHISGKIIAVEPDGPGFVVMAPDPSNPAASIITVYGVRQSEIPAPAEEELIDLCSDEQVPAAAPAKPAEEVQMAEQLPFIDLNAPLSGDESEPAPARNEHTIQLVAIAPEAATQQRAHDPADYDYPAPSPESSSPSPAPEKAAQAAPAAAVTIDTHVETPKTASPHNGNWFVVVSDEEADEPVAARATASCPKPVSPSILKHGGETAVGKQPETPKQKKTVRFNLNPDNAAAAAPAATTPVAPIAQPAPAIAAAMPEARRHVGPRQTSSSFERDGQGRLPLKKRRLNGDASDNGQK